jgi:integrase/recombinase XerD
MGYIERVSDEIADILVGEGLDYNQTKTVFQLARRKAGLKPPKPKRGAIARLTLEEELRFIDQAYLMGGRVGMMMQTLLETGARVSEFINLRVEDISFAERLIMIEDGKGGKRREIPIRREMAKLLQAHVSSRRSGPLFRSRQKGAGHLPYIYTRQRIGQMVRQVARDAGIRKRIYPHLLRHTIATKLLNLGLDIADVQRFLGHEDISTTQIYAVTSVAALQRKFDQVTDPYAHTLVEQIHHNRGAQAAVFASELLRNRAA